MSDENENWKEMWKSLLEQSGVHIFEALKVIDYSKNLVNAQESDRTDTGFS